MQFPRVFRLRGIVLEVIDVHVEAAATGLVERVGEFVVRLAALVVRSSRVHKRFSIFCLFPVLHGEYWGVFGA